MKFQRTDLIARVNTEIERRTQAAAERTAKANQEHQERRQEYLSRTGPAWKTFADTIRARQRSGRPITAADIPEELRDSFGRKGGYVAVWNEGEPHEYEAQTDDLTALLGVLDATTDDEVTTASLERLGVRLGSLFR